MSDEKLEILIEKYRSECYLYGVGKYADAEAGVALAKQAIIEYVDKEGKARVEKWQLEIAYKHGTMDATKYIRAAREKYKERGVGYPHDRTLCYPMTNDLWQAIKKDVEG